MRWIAGIDEVGRGPLAGPLVMGLCILPDNFSHPHLDHILATQNVDYPWRDSKLLSIYQRNQVFRLLRILQQQKDIQIFHVSIPAQKIDRIGMRSALRLALTQLTERVPDVHQTRFVLDGALRLSSPYKSTTLIQGDRRELSIALASIYAKVKRDQYMQKQGKKFTGYGFERHKGYGTPEHIRAIHTYGPVLLHRKSFLKRILGKTKVFLNDSRTHG